MPRTLLYAVLALATALSHASAAQAAGDELPRIHLLAVAQSNDPVNGP